MSGRTRRADRRPGESSATRRPSQGWESRSGCRTLRRPLQEWMQVLADRPKMERQWGQRNIWSCGYTTNRTSVKSQPSYNELHVPHWWIRAERAPQPAPARSHLNTNIKQSEHRHGGRVMRTETRAPLCNNRGINVNIKISFIDTLSTHIMHQGNKHSGKEVVWLIYVLSETSTW